MPLLDHEGTFLKERVIWRGTLVALLSLLSLGLGYFFGVWVGGISWGLTGVVAITLIGPILAELVGHFCSELFWPTSRPIPPPLYKLTDRYVQDGRLEEAAEEYEKILHYHPAERQAYIGLLNVLARLHRPRAEAQQLIRRARRHLRDPQVMGELETILEQKWALGRGGL